MKKLSLPIDLNDVLSIAFGALMAFSGSWFGIKGLIKGLGYVCIFLGFLKLWDVFFTKDAEGRRVAQGMPMLYGVILAIASVGFGVCLFVFLDSFRSVAPLVLSGFIYVFAIAELYYLAIGCRPHLLPAWLYVFPAVMIVCGITVMLQEGDATGNLTEIFGGVAFIVLGVCRILCKVFMNRILMAERLEREEKKRLKSLEDVE